MGMRTSGSSCERAEGALWSVVVILRNLIHRPCTCPPFSDVVIGLVPRKRPFIGAQFILNII